MSAEEYKILKSRGTDNISASIQIAACLTVSQAASALGKLAKGHKKTGLTEAELARRRSQGAKLNGFKAAKPPTSPLGTVGRERPAMCGIRTYEIRSE